MFTINPEKCIGCRQCVKDCPANDIMMTDAHKAFIKNERCLACGHCIAICPKEAVSTNCFDMSEVKTYEAASFELSPEHLMNFIKSRRSTRQFTEEAIEKEVIEQIIEAGRFTQTATNSQDVSYIVLSERLEEVKTTIYEILNQKGTYLLENLTPETEHLKNYAQLWINMHAAHKSAPKVYDRLFFNAPTVILVTANNPTNGALASTNMELMAKAYGLGSCFCGFALVALNDRPDLLEQLGVEPGKSIISCLVMGHPKVTYKRTVPRKAAHIVWN